MWRELPTQFDLSVLNACRASKGEKGLPLRGAVELDDPEYAGRRVSRDAVFGDEPEGDISEDE